MCLVSKTALTASCEIKLDTLLGYNSKKKKKIIKKKKKKSHQSTLEFTDPVRKRLGCD